MQNTLIIVHKQHQNEANEQQLIHCKLKFAHQTLIRITVPAQITIAFILFSHIRTDSSTHIQICKNWR